MFRTSSGEFIKFRHASFNTDKTIEKHWTATDETYDISNSICTYKFISSKLNEILTEAIKAEEDCANFKILAEINSI